MYFVHSEHTKLSSCASSHYILASLLVVDFTLFALGATSNSQLFWVHAWVPSAVVNFPPKLFQSSISLLSVGYKVQDFNYN